MFAFQGLFGVVHLVLFLGLFNCETPKFLRMTGQQEKLNQVLGRIYDAKDVEKVKLNMTFNASTNTRDVSFKQALTAPKYRRATWTSSMILFFRHFSGMTCLTVYSYPIYELTGVVDPALGSLVVQGVNLLLTVFVSYLLAHFGRKTLLIQGQLIMGLNFFVMGYCLNYDYKMAVFVSSLVFIAGFATSFGPVSFLYASETCSDKGMSFVTLVHWSMGILTTFITPYLIRDFTMAGTFYFYGGFSLVGSQLITFLVKETKGLTDNQCQSLYSSPEKSPKQVVRSTYTKPIKIDKIKESEIELLETISLEN